jgi:parallel beta-helix repeat protein
LQASVKRYMLWSAPIIVLAALALFVAGQNGHSDSDAIQQQWLRAESLKDPVQAVAAWEAITSTVSADAVIASGVKGENARLALLTSYLAAALKTGDENYIGKAESLAAQEQDSYQKFWQYLTIARQISVMDNTRAAENAAHAEALIGSVQNVLYRAYAAHGLIASGLEKNKKGTLLFGEEGKNYARQWLSEVRSPFHYADAMRRAVLGGAVIASQWPEELRKAIAVPYEKGEDRDEELYDLYKEYRAKGEFNLALDALSALADDDDMQQETLYEWFKGELKAKQESNAAAIANRIFDGRYAGQTWAQLSRYYAKEEASDKAEQAKSLAFAFIDTERKPERRAKGLLEMAEDFMEAGDATAAERAMEAAEAITGESSSISGDAKGSLIKTLAESGKLDEAQAMLKEFSTDDAELLSVTISAVAKSLAEDKKPEQAEELLSEQSLEDTPQLQKAWYATVKAYAGDNQFDKARELLGNITDKELRQNAEKIIASEEKAESDDEDEDEKKSDEEGFNDDRLSNAFGDFASLFIASAHAEEAEIALNKTVDKKRTALNFTELSEKALKLAEEGNTREAVDLAVTVEDPHQRASLFRQIAELTAQQLDSYGLLDSSKENTFEKNEDYQEPKLAEGFSLQAPPASTLGVELPPLPNRERLAYNTETIRQRIPSLSPFKVHRIFYENSYYLNSKLTSAIRNASTSIAPDALFLESGVASLPQLQEAVVKLGMPEALVKSGNHYLLRKALVVGPHATLVVNGREVDSLRLSLQSPGFIANAGKLFIVDSRVHAWDENANDVYRSGYEDRYKFRPFITSWSRSETHIGNTQLIGLGFSYQKSYGLSLSAGPEKLVSDTISEPKRPTGIIVDNSFEDMFYGFYSYEADDVALIGNEYKDNIVYGIDPHDRSRRLTMAYNTAYGTVKKHGIIISREVNDSEYIGNVTFDNYGSGFMIDRLSTGTYVYANKAFDNLQDGLTLFESSCNLIAANDFSHNKRVGIRVRNSQDTGIFGNTLSFNRQGAVLGYISELLNDPAHAMRDFELDPYAPVTAMSLVGNTIQKNGVGINVDGMAALLMKANDIIDQSPKLFVGDWFRERPYITSQYDIHGTGIVITDTCRPGKWLPHSCRFREMGAFDGDGQAHLREAMKTASCKAEVRS